MEHSEPPVPQSKSEEHRRSLTIRGPGGIASLDPSIFTRSNEIEVIKEYRKLDSFAEKDDATSIAGYIDTLKDKDSDKRNILSECLQKINDILSEKSYHFIDEFINNNGLTNLCALSPIYYDDNEVLKYLLSIFETILNVPPELATDDSNCDEMETKNDPEILNGFSLILSHSHTIQCITDMFESNDKNVMCKVMQLLTSICMYNDEGFEKLIMALYSYGDNHSASSIFDEFVKSMFHEHDLEFRRDALKFINVVLNCAPSLKTRIDARRYLTELGFQNIMQELWDFITEKEQQLQNSSRLQISPSNSGSTSSSSSDNDNDNDNDSNSENKDYLQESKDEEEKSNQLMHSFIQSVLDKKDLSRKRMLESEYEPLNNALLESVREQLKTYGELEESDHNEMLWNNLDLDDPQALVNYLFMKAVNQRNLASFMNTLIALASIPDAKYVIYFNYANMY